MAVELEDLILIRSDIFPGEFIRDDTGKKVKLENLEPLKSAPVIAEIMATHSGRHAYSPFKGEYPVPERANALLLGDGYSIKTHIASTNHHVIYPGSYCILKKPDSDTEQSSETSAPID